jgi:hypothetical protein
MATEKKNNFAVMLQQRLFTAEPSAVLQRMALEAELPIANETVRAGSTVTSLRTPPRSTARTTSSRSYGTTPLLAQ